MTSAVVATLPDNLHLKEVVYFNPDQTPITTLRRAIANAQDLLLRLDVNNELMVLGSRNEYFSRLEDEETFFLAPVENMAVSILPRGDQRLPPSDSVGRSVEELMWRAGYYASDGRLIQGCSPLDMVEIEHWPNLTRVPHTNNTARIVALLARHPAPVAFVARLLKIPPAEIYQFYSAAYCAGIAHPVNREVEEPKLAPHRQQTLLGALWNKIVGL